MNLELAGILLAVIGQGLYIAYRIGKFEEKLNTIEEKQEKHNNFIERLYNVEKELSVEHEKIDVANHRIEDLEKGIK